MDEKIEKAIQPLIQMYEKIENDLLNKIASHFLLNDEFLNSDHWRIKKLDEMGLFNQDIINYLSRYTGKSKEEIIKALKQIGIDTIDLENLNRLFEDEVLKINPNNLLNNYTIQNIINSAYNEVSNTFIQMSSKIEEGARNAYLKVVEEAYLKTSMGTHSYQEAIRTAINDLGNRGITTLTYKTTDDDGNVVGLRNYDVEGAARREILTAARQLSGNINMQLIEELQPEYIYLSEHLECRPTHFDWQGTIIKREDLVAVTDYGDVGGLYGINCRHYAEPYFGTERGNELKQFSKKECTDAYNKSQKQRYLERGIRKWKRKAEMFKVNGDKEYQLRSIRKVNEWQKQLLEFADDNKLKREYSREFVSGYKETKVNLKPSASNVKLLKEAGIKADDSLGKMNGSLLRKNAIQLKSLSEKYEVKDFYETYDVGYYCSDGKYVAAVSYPQDMSTFSIHSSYKYYMDKQKHIDVQREKQATGWSMPCLEENYEIYTMTHEFGHTLEIKMFKSQYPFGDNHNYLSFSNQVKSDIIDIAIKNNPNFDYSKCMSEYGTRNSKEFFAEVFANMELGKPNELGLAMKEYLKQKGVLK